MQRLNNFASRLKKVRDWRKWMHGGRERIPVIQDKWGGRRPESRVVLLDSGAVPKAVDRLGSRGSESHAGLASAHTWLVYAHGSGPWMTVPSAEVLGIVT